MTLRIERLWSGQDRWYWGGVEQTPHAIRLFYAHAFGRSWWLEVPRAGAKSKRRGQPVYPPNHDLNLLLWALAALTLWLVLVLGLAGCARWLA